MSSLSQISTPIFVDVSLLSLSLPKDVIAHVFQFCNVLDLCRLSRVCKLFYKVVHNHPLVWKGAVWNGMDYPVSIPEEYSSKKAANITHKEVLLANVRKFSILEVFRTILTCAEDTEKHKRGLSDSLNIFYLKAASGATISTIHRLSNLEEKEYFNNAIKAAAKMKNLDVLRIAIKTGARPNEKSFDLALDLGDELNDPELENKLTKLVDQSGAEPQSQENLYVGPKSTRTGENKFLKTLRHIRKNNIELLRMVVELDEKFEDPKACFNAALEKSAELNISEPIDLAVSAQAKPEKEAKSQDNSFNLAIKYAIQYKCVMVLYWSYNHGARPCSDSFDQALIHFCDSQSPDFEFLETIFEHLKKFGVFPHNDKENSLSSKSSFNQALICAADKDPNKFIKPLLRLVIKLGGEPNYDNTNKPNPKMNSFNCALSIAERPNLLHILNIALEEGAIPNTGSFNYGIEIAFRANSRLIVLQMLYLGLKPDQESFNKALEWAAYFNEMELLSEMTISGITPSEDSLDKAISLFNSKRKISSQNKISLLRCLVRVIKANASTKSFDLALETGMMLVIQLVIAAGALPSQESFNKAFVLSIQKEDIKFFQKAVAQKARPNADSIILIQSYSTTRHKDILALAQGEIKRHLENMEIENGSVSSPQRSQYTGKHFLNAENASQGRESTKKARKES